VNFYSGFGGMDGAVFVGVDGGGTGVDVAVVRGSTLLGNCLVLI
jgi:hypothetical protein